jgi:hypothetical protein
MHLFRGKEFLIARSRGQRRLSVKSLGSARCAYGSTRSASRLALYSRILNYIRVTTVRLTISHFIRSKCDIHIEEDARRSRASEVDSLEPPHRGEAQCESTEEQVMNQRRHRHPQPPLQSNFPPSGCS